MERFRLIKILSTLTTITVGILILLLITTSLVYFQPAFFKELIQPPELWVPNSLEHDLPDGREGKIIKYGYLLASQTPNYIGPMVDNQNMRFTGNNLSCKNCHLKSGAQKGAASWVGVTDRYPQFRGRENKNGSIEERINGCMERSMNGKPLPQDSDEMKALVAYMDWLGEGIPETRLNEFKGFPSIHLPNYAADTIKGKVIYMQECVQCHGENGEGVKLQNSVIYQYPPLWGKDSYNHGAGMHRVITAAQFIKGNMPWGQATSDNPKLTDEEAYHVAAYINSFSRPRKNNTDKDFPNRLLKPVSTPYGPWDDPFPASQHKYGPFKPIVDYYQTEYKIKKTK